MKRFAVFFAAIFLVATTSAHAATISSQYYASSAFNDAYGQYGDGHSLVLFNNSYTFQSGALFTIYDDNTATLTGTGLASGSANGYDVNLSFALDPSFSNPKLELIPSAYAANGGPVDPSTWSYWSLLPGSTLTGIGAFAGEVYNITSKPASGLYTFQLGNGANGKNAGFGLSGWFYETSPPQDALCSSLTCDFNINLTPVPLPMGALLLPAALGLLVGVRRRRRAV